MGLYQAAEAYNVFLVFITHAAMRRGASANVRMLN